MISYGYDTMGRLHTTTYPQGVLTRGYDPAKGQLISLGSSTGEGLAFTYDGFLSTGTTWSGVVAGSVGFGYDTTFRMTSQTVDGVGLSFGYDNDNLLTQAGALSIVRDPYNGQIKQTTLGGITDVYGYDANGALASYVASYGPSLLYSETIVLRDGDGRITQRTETVGAVTHAWGYTYDAAGRLTDVSEDGTPVSHYGYDANDNRTTFMNASGSVFATYDAQDRLMTYGSATYSYGPNGELQTKTVGTQTSGYDYDVFGNLRSATLPDRTALVYIVDGQSRRVGKLVNGTLTAGFLYQDQLNIVAQLDGSGNLLSRFVFATRANVPDYFTSAVGTFRIVSDHLGSPRLIVNVANGSILETVDYDEFGNVTNDTNPGVTPFGFAGGLYDAGTGLLRFGARDYDPAVGRWTSKDRVRFQGGMNLYGYVSGDPEDRVDSTGEADTLVCSGTCLDPYHAANAACLKLVGAAAQAKCLNKAYGDLLCCCNPSSCKPPPPPPPPLPNSCNPEPPSGTLPASAQ